MRGRRGRPPGVLRLAGLCVRLASLCVPRSMRADWREEWTAELGRAADVLLGTRGGGLRLIRMAAGAFVDAWSVRRAGGEARLRRIGRGRVWSGVGQDIRRTLRSIAASPGLALGIAGSLAVGIAANIAAFSVLQTLLFRPFPEVVRQEELLQICAIRHEYQGCNTTVEEYAALSGFLADAIRVSALYPFDAVIKAGDQARSARGAVISHNYFEVLGIRPAIGQFMMPVDDPSGGEPVSVISHKVWQRDFAGRSDALGATVHVNGLPTRVIGVAPEPFVGVRRKDYQTDVWVPIVYAAAILKPDPGRPGDGSGPRPAFVDVVGRLAPTATAGQVEERAQRAVIALFESQLPDTPAETASSRGRPRRPVVSVRPVMLNDPSQWPGAAASIGFVPAIVLVVACINAGLLLVARAGRRRREWTVRLALGSTRWRIMRLVLFEALALSLLAVGPALGIAAGLLQLAQVRWPLPMPVDARAVLFSIAASAFTAVAFGLGPAWTVARHATPVTSFLGRFTSRARARVTLVGVQAALCVALLMTGFQFVRAIDLRTQPGGVSDPDRLTVTRIDLESLHYADAQASELFVRLLAGVRTLPGVDAAVLSSAPYWGALDSSGGSVRVLLPGEAAASGQADRGSGRFSPATLVDGQLFQALDLRASGSSLVSDREPNRWEGVVVNRAFEEHILKGPALGRRIRLGSPPPEAGTEIEVEIVGVVDNAIGPRLDSKPHLYYSAGTSPGGTNNVRYLYLRVAKGAQVGQPLRALVAGLDDRIAVEVSSLREILMTNRQDERWLAQALQVLGGLGLVLAAVGLFGIVAYVVIERTHEIGLRMALGAPAGRVVVMIWRQAMTPVLVGLVVGSAAAVGTGLVVRSRLYGTQPVDLVALGMTSGFMLIVMSLASFIPARRATRIDPRVTLGDV